MAFTSTITPSVQLSGAAVAALALAALTNSSSPAEHVAVTTVNGANTLTPPTTGTLFLIIIPPTGSSITKTLKGVTGDTGVPLSLTNWSLISLAATPGALVLTTNGVETLDIWWL